MSQKLTILCLEDESTARNELSELLRTRDCNVLPAESAKQAVALAQSNKIDLVLADIKMNGEIDGIDAAKEIQNIYPGSKLVFVTAYSNDHQYRQRVLNSNVHVSAWIDKPLIGTSRRHLLSIIKYEEKRLRKIAPWECITNQDLVKEPRIFVCYEPSDEEFTTNILNKIKDHKLGDLLRVYALQGDKSLLDTIAIEISAGDYLLVIISRASLVTRWVQNELAVSNAIGLPRRGITILPILIEDYPIPKSLETFRIIDLSQNFETSLTRLVDQLDIAPNLNFEQLDSPIFENLVRELLLELGFKSVKRVSDKHDFLVDYSFLDPFGEEITEQWLGISKFYRKARPDLRFLHDFAESLVKCSQPTRGLVVTNGQLTSASLEWLKTVREDDGIDLRVIDGVELKRILLQHNTIAKKFFSLSVDQ